MDTTYSPPALAVGVLLRDPTSKAVYRVVTPEGAGQFVALYDIGKGQNTWPEPIPADEIRRRMDPSGPSEDRLTVEAADPWSSENRPPRSGYDQSRLDSDWHLIEALLTGPTAFRLMLPKYRNGILNDHARLNHTTRQKLTRLLRRYWQRGLTRSALMDDRNLCGGKDKVKIFKNVKSGRRPRNNYPGLPLNEIARQILNQAADWLLQDWKHRTYRGALEEYAQKFCVGRTALDAHGRKVVIKATDRRFQPTARQLQHLVLRWRPHAVVKRSKLGKRKFELIGRAFTGRADQHVTCPGHAVIDATIADAYLLSIFDRISLVGRPTVYFAIDLFSRLIVGIYVGFEPPSWVAAMMLLTNVVTPKVAYCAQFGITISEDQWPCHHMPTTLFGDKGEMMKVRAGQLLSSEFGIHIENAPSGRPDAKSIVELRFNTIQRPWGAFMPGYVDRDYDERGSRDPRQDAALTLYEFTQIIILAVLRHNAAPISDFPPIPDLVAEGGAPTPLELWDYGISSTGGLLRNDSVETVRRYVLPRERATVTHKGIEFGKYCYLCPAARDGDWHIKGRDTRWTVEIAFDPSNLDCIYLCEDGRFEKCTKAGTNSKYVDREGASMAERNVLEDRQKANLERAKDDDFAFRVSAKEIDNEIVKEATKKTKEALKQAGLRKPQVYDLRKTRERERAAEREHLTRVEADFIAAVGDERKSSSDLHSNRDSKQRGDARRRITSSMRAHQQAAAETLRMSKKSKTLDILKQIRR
ncbi:Mu transposase C-terminal domain-containing protein [Caballeronia sp. LZ008]|uniref:Mu transposase C-terminal domain-containing protein n=1 Tax=unclassified Caballeronia TaxID=2646786 RepID=UPI002028CE58|nr:MULTISPECIES: Mu transposase C-terminal domain-containing protein [unclassified Caballeronia]MDR5796495.1 Mu transposase C-terminal domain-containing protein [Caballeronia sp. LZ008]